MEMWEKVLSTFGGMTAFLFLMFLIRFWEFVDERKNEADAEQERQEKLDTLYGRKG